MKPKLSVLIPTRGRTDMLDRSLSSLLEHADDPSTIEFLFAFDDDDSASQEYFLETIAPKFDAVDCEYTIFEMPRLGYENLHKYLNILGSNAQADWWMFWNDDAIMLDDHWDTVITSEGDNFCIQQFDTHNLHPYSIFPIVPRAWYDTLGHLSRHPLNDAYISQIGWMLDIMKRIHIRVTHDRFDLTGENKDETFDDRPLTQLEGNPDNATDFNYRTQIKYRTQDANKLAIYLDHRGYDLSYWNAICSGKQDPWERMFAADVNNHVARITKYEA